MKKTLSICCFALVVLAVCSTLSFAKPVTIAVAPFTVNSESGFDFLKTGIIDLFSSRLASEGRIIPVDKVKIIQAFKDSGEITETSAIEKAAALGADYLLFGTIEESPKGINVESFLVSKTPGEKTLPFFEKSSQYESADVIMLIIERITTNIKRDIFKIAVPVETMEQPATSPGNIHAHPDTYLKDIGIEEEK